jgi:hypothetical protein
MPKGEFLMSVLKRVDKNNAEQHGPAAFDETWEIALPALHEYLTSTTWPDEQPRQVATLLLLAEQGRFKVMINDRANSRVAWFSGETVEAALQAANHALLDGGADWRAGSVGRASRTGRS